MAEAVSSMAAPAVAAEAPAAPPELAAPLSSAAAPEACAALATPATVKACPLPEHPGWNALWTQLYAVLQRLGSEHAREVDVLHAKIVSLEIRNRPQTSSQACPQTSSQACAEPETKVRSKILASQATTTLKFMPPEVMSASSTLRSDIQSGCGSGPTSLDTEAVHTLKVTHIGAGESAQASLGLKESPGVLVPHNGANFSQQISPQTVASNNHVMHTEHRSLLQLQENSLEERAPGELAPAHQDFAPPVGAMMALASDPLALEPMPCAHLADGAPALGAMLALTERETSPTPVLAPRSQPVGTSHGGKRPLQLGEASRPSLLVPSMAQSSLVQQDTPTGLNGTAAGLHGMAFTHHSSIATDGGWSKATSCGYSRVARRSQVPCRSHKTNLAGAQETSDRSASTGFEDDYDKIDPSHRQPRVLLKELWQNIEKDASQWRVKSTWSDRATVVDVHAKLSKQQSKTIALVKTRSHHAMDDKHGSCTESTMRRFVAHPSARWRLVWDLMGMMFLSFDLVMIPLQVFGDVVDLNSGAVVIFSWLTSIYWTGDMFTSFFVGFHTRGAVEMSPKKIVLRYLRTWFLLDISLVAVDWTFISMGFGQQASYMRVGKTMSRGMRVMRLLRIVKMHAVFSDLMERIRSEYVRTLMSIGNIVAFIVIINHFLACGWYGLQYLNKGNQTWNEVHIRSEHSLGYRYATSLHWSLTQFTPASMEVTPKNGIERVYSVCVLLFALITFSSFVSSITQAMTHLRTINARKLEQQTVLRRYLNQHGISGQLVNRVWHYLHLRVVQNSVKVRTKEHQVPMLDLLPLSMRVELRVESFTPELIKHPFFFIYSHMEPHALRAICNRAISELSLITRQELFHAETAKVQMFFVSEGCLEYMLPCNCAARDNLQALEDGLEREDVTKLEKIQQEEGVLDEEIWENEDVRASTTMDLEYVSKCDRVPEGKWACELALWSSKLELCSAFVATERSEILLISYDEIQDIILKYKDSCGRASKYGASFVDYVGSMTQCRWRAAISNDFSVIQDLSHRAVGFDGTQKKRAGVKRGRISVGHRAHGSFRHMVREMVGLSEHRSSTTSTFGEQRSTGEHSPTRSNRKSGFFAKINSNLGSMISSRHSKVGVVDEEPSFSHLA